MFFATPSYLFALAGMLVPLAIHLWSKKEGRVIKIGSIQFLAEEDAKKSSSISINELGLLLLRMLLLAVLSLILAQLFFKAPAKRETKALFIDPQLKNNLKVTRLMDSLKDYDIYWFALGFPPRADMPDSKNAKTLYWQLLNMLDDFPAKDIVLATRAKLANLHGKRPVMHRPISWITINEPHEKEFIEEAIPTKNGGYYGIKGASSNDRTTFAKARLAREDTVNISNLIADSLRIYFTVGKNFEIDSIFIKAALDAIRNYTQWPMVFVSTAENADWSIWLSDQPLKHKKGYYLAWHADSLADGLIRQTKSPTLYYLTDHLDQETIVKEDFVGSLFAILRESRIDNKPVDAANDERVVDDRQLMPVTSGTGAGTKKVNQPMSSYLWGLFGLLFLGERVLAFVRNQ